MDKSILSVSLPQKLEIEPVPIIFIYPCRSISSYIRILSKESTHDRALSVRGTLV